MPRTLVDFLIEKTKREEKYFKNYLKYAKLIKKEAQNILGDAKVFVFGSILKKDEVSQDIDILIISPQLKESAKRNDVLIRIQRKMDLFSPFEIHFATPEEYKFWWKHFLKEKTEI